MSDVLTMHILKGHEHEPSPKHRYAQAYVPDQKMTAIYPPEEGIQAGTVFPELNQPYTGWQKYPEC